jgi:hypothetical protein
MLPHPWLMARIGHSMAEMQVDDQVRACRTQSSQWEQYARELEARLKEVTDKYHLLGLASAKMIGDFEIVEQERDALFEENQELYRHLADLKAAAECVQSVHQKAKTHFDRFMDENEKRLRAYGVMKDFLEKLFENAEMFLTESITVEQREKMRRYLDQLPD